jgi:hypothetical protein
MRIGVWALGALLLFQGIAWADDTELLREIEITRAMTDAQRKALVADAMDLSASEAEIFWPLYRDYRNEMSAAGDRFVRLITEFTEDSANLTDEQAAGYLDEWLSVDAQLRQVRNKHVKKFRKKLPASTVLRFFQIDNKLNQLILIQLAEAIPLAE